MVNTEIRLIIFLAAEDGGALYSQQNKNGRLSGSDHELLIAKFRLKLMKVGKITRSFRYDRNQIPYDYTVEMTNRFQGLDLIDRVPEELWTQRFVIWYRRQVAQTVKVSVYNVGDLGSSPGLGRSPGEGNGNPLQYYCLENPMDRGAW